MKQYWEVFDPDRLNWRSLFPLFISGLVVSTIYSFSLAMGNGAVSALSTFGGTLSLICNLLGFFGIVAWLMRQILAFSKSFWHWAWRKAACNFLVLICVPILSMPGWWVGDYVHFGLSYPYYLTKIIRARDGSPMRTEFRWGSTGFVSTIQTDRMLVFDPAYQTVMQSEKL